MSEATNPPVGLVCSVSLEAEPVLEQLRHPQQLRVGGKPAALGELNGVAVLLVVGGMGKTNAAQALTALLETREVRGVVGFGVGGAYPGADLDVGGLALASSEVYGDEGVQTPAGWISTQGIGIPLVDRPDACLFNEFPMPAERLATAERALRAAGLDALSGPFVTVSCCSGEEVRGRELAERFGAICETMEGAAYAHVCALYGVPFLEVRGISNRVEDRDLSRWRLRAAAAAAAAALPTLAAVAASQK